MLNVSMGHGLPAGYLVKTKALFDMDVLNLLEEAEQS